MQQDRAIQAVPTTRPFGIRAIQLAVTQLLSAGVIVGGAGMVSPGAVQAQQAPAVAAKSYAIPAGPLGPALTRFATDAGVLLSFDPALAAGRTSKGLSGSYLVPDALSALLADTGLDAVPQDKGGWLLVARPASSRATDETVQAALPEVTVLGSRAPGASLSNVPASISQVKGQTIQRDLATSARIEQILARNVPGVHPSNVGVRVIRGRTAQVFVNGAPMNEQMRYGSASDLDTISPDHLRAIEVSRGANSAYGFGSSGGIIALTTPRAETETLALETRLRTSFNTDHRGGSFQSTAYQSASQIVGAFDYHVAVSANRDGTNYTPDGEVANIFTSPGMFKNGDEKIYNFDTSLGYDMGRAGRLRFTATSQYIDYIKSYDIDGGVYRGAHATATPVPNGDLSYRRAQTYNLSYENNELAGQALKLEFFGSRVASNRFEAGNERYPRQNDYIGFRSAVTSRLDAIVPKAAVTWGLDAVRNEDKEYLYDTVTGALTGMFGPPARMDMLAPYAQFDVPVGKTRFSGGVRHERYGGRVESTGNGTVTPADDGPGGKIRDFHMTLFNLGLLQPLTAQTDLQATYTQGAEISQIRRSGFLVASADRIEPQPARSHQIEVGLRHKGQALSGSATAFFTRSNLMSGTDCSDQNLPCKPLREPRRIWGLEFTGDWAIDAQWKLVGILGWQDGRREAQGSAQWTRMSSVDITPVNGSATLSYSPSQNWRNDLIVDWRGSRGRIGDGWPYGQVESVTLLHLSSSIKVGPGVLTLGINNLLDKTYYAIQAEAYNGGWVWLPEQGRRVSLGYAVKW